MSVAIDTEIEKWGMLAGTGHGTGHGTTIWIAVSECAKFVLSEVYKKLLEIHSLIVRRYEAKNVNHKVVKGGGDHPQINSHSSVRCRDFDGRKGEHL